MENYDSEWNRRTGAETIISYKNIPSGEYKLMIKAATQNSLEHQQVKSLGLTILPPWWKTVYAKFGYIVSMLLLFVYIRYTVHNRHLRKIIQIEARKEKELNNSKLAFFIFSITHSVLYVFTSRAVLMIFASILNSFAA